MSDRLKCVLRIAVPSALASVFVGWLILNGGSPVRAQQPESPPQPPAQPPAGDAGEQPPPQMMPQQTLLDPDEISEQDLEAAAEIHRKVEELNEELRESLTEVDDQEMIRKKVRAAEEKLETSAEEIGLSLDKHEQIMQTIQQDAELRRDFLLLVQGEPELSPEDLGEDELAQAADVFVELQQLNQQLQQQLATMQDHDAAQALIEDAEQSLDDKAEETGIGLDRYEKVMELLQVDLELQEEFLEIVEANMPQQPPQPDPQQQQPQEPMPPME